MEKKWKQWQIFIFLGSKIIADGDCIHWIKKCLLLGRKAMTSLYSVLKSRDISLPTKVHRVKAMIFPVIMYRCELDRKEGSPPKNWCFQIVVLEKSFENLLAARGSNKSILKTIYLEYSLEGLILKLKLQNFSYVKANSLEKTPVLGNIEGRRRRG